MATASPFCRLLADGQSIALAAVAVYNRVVEIPGADRALVEPEKLRDYLLSSSHPIGRFKAAFFAVLGFHPEHWLLLRDELLAAVRSPEAEPGQSSPFGQKYEVRATLRGPAGSARVISVWIVLHGDAFPRFVTAFPE